MNIFFREKGVLVCELEQLKKNAIEQLGWSYQSWQRRVNGTTPLTPAERMALEKVLDDMRSGASVIYNIK